MYSDMVQVAHGIQQDWINSHGNRAFYRYWPTISEIPLDQVDTPIVFPDKTVYTIKKVRDESQYQLEPEMTQVDLAFLSDDSDNQSDTSDGDDSDVDLKALAREVAWLQKNS